MINGCIDNRLLLLNAYKEPSQEICRRFGDYSLSLSKDTGIAPSTAYNLYDNPDWIPQVTALNKICDFYRVQPSELIYWVPPEEIKEDKEDK